MGGGERVERDNALIYGMGDRTIPRAADRIDAAADGPAHKGRRRQLQPSRQGRPKAKIYA
jgi:hypothetical protein